MGLQVIVTDYNPDALGMKDADIPIVMSTRDIEGSVREAKAQNEITPIHAVLTVGTDAAPLSDAYIDASNPDAPPPITATFFINLLGN